MLDLTAADLKIDESFLHWALLPIKHILPVIFNILRKKLISCPSTTQYLEICSFIDKEVKSKNKNLLIHKGLDPAII